MVFKIPFLIRNWQQFKKTKKSKRNIRKQSTDFINLSILLTLPSMLKISPSRKVNSTISPFPLRNYSFNIFFVDLGSKIIVSQFPSCLNIVIAFLFVLLSNCILSKTMLFLTRPRNKKM